MMISTSSSAAVLYHKNTTDTSTVDATRLSQQTQPSVEGEAQLGNTVASSLELYTKYQLSSQQTSHSVVVSDKDNITEFTSHDHSIDIKESHTQLASIRASVVISPQTSDLTTALEHWVGQALRADNIIDLQGSSETVFQELSITHVFQTQEHESSVITLTGEVMTQDGRSISYMLELTMDRQFVEQHVLQTNLQQGVFTDPLVINLEQKPVSLSDKIIQFDLLQDGEERELNFVSSGSGYLVLDKNNNDEVDHGGELFGPSSGSGYSDLSLFDDDGNGWIDTADSVFSELKLWHQNDKGELQLTSIEDAGIGAISLEAVASPFTITDENNTELAKITNTSVVLFENGHVTSMQELHYRFGRQPDAQPQPDLIELFDSQQTSLSAIFAPSQINMFSAFTGNAINTIRASMEQETSIRIASDTYFDASKYQVTSTQFTEPLFDEQAKEQHQQKLHMMQMQLDVLKEFHARIKEKRDKLQRQIL